MTRITTLPRSLAPLICSLALLGCGVSTDSGPAATGPAATGVATDRLTGHATDAVAVPERVEPIPIDPDAPRRTGKLSDRFPNVVLTTHDNRKLRFYDDLIKDRTVIINFLYTRCTGSCPGTTATLVQVHEILGKRMGKDVWMLSLTIDPQHDTPQVLREYMDTWDCHKPGWLYLTGDYDDITRIRRALGVYDLDPQIDADRTQHAGILTFGNDRTNRWAGLPGRTLPGDIARTVLRLTSRPLTLGESHGPATIGRSAAGGALAGRALESSESSIGR